ncbi:hypothetical protein [Streptomyces syringium]|uniref:hypothetical protein n=1 Tax=Streptomyces syringium TaxID=76729 RepID=UPI0033AED398
MSNAVAALLVVLVSLVLTCLVAIMIHGRIAGQAVRRARAEDLPRMLEASGRTLVGLLSAFRMRVRQAFPADVARGGNPSAPAVGAGDAVGAEETAQ